MSFAGSSGLSDVSIDAVSFDYANGASASNRVRFDRFGTPLVRTGSSAHDLTAGVIALTSGVQRVRVHLSPVTGRGTVE